MFIGVLNSNLPIDPSEFKDLNQSTLLSYSDMQQILENHNKILSDFAKSEAYNQNVQSDLDLMKQQLNQIAGSGTSG